MTTRRIHADADGASARTIEHRRKADIEFLDWLKRAPLGTLMRMRSDAEASGPLWRRIAIQRELTRRSG